MARHKRGQKYTKEEVEKLKQQFIEQFELSRGLLVESANRIGVNHKSIYRWIENDKEFAEKIEEIKKRANEFVEGQLMHLIEEGRASAIFFYLKCKGGYSETNRLEIANKNDIDINAAIEELRQQILKKNV